MFFFVMVDISVLMRYSLRWSLVGLSWSLVGSSWL